MNGRAAYFYLTFVFRLSPPSPTSVPQNVPWAFPLRHPLEFIGFHFYKRLLYNYPTGKVLRYINYFNKQTRCRLGANLVQTRCPDGTRELFPSNYVLHYFRYRLVQTRCRLGSRMEPESYFHPITSSTIEVGALGAKNLMHPRIILGPFWVTPRTPNYGCFSPPDAQISWILLVLMSPPPRFLCLPRSR